MALDEVVNAGRDFITIAQINEEKNDPDTLNHYLNYASGAGEPVTQEAMDFMGKTLSKPGVLPKVIKESLEEDYKSLAETVSKNYQETLNALSGEGLVSAALRIPDKDKDFYGIDQLIEAERYDAVRDAYSKTFENKVWKKVVKRADPELLKQFASSYVKIQESKFIEKYSKEVKTEDGKPAKEPDNDKLREYIRKTIEDYKNYGNEEEIRKIKEGAYVILGQTCTMSKLGIKPQKQRTKSDDRNFRGKRRPKRR